MDQWILILTVSLLVVLSGGLVFSRSYASCTAFKRRVSKALLHLGIQKKKLAELPAYKLHAECEAMHATLGWRANPYRVAARFFTWYATEYDQPQCSTYVTSTSVADSIEKMAEWAKANPKLKASLDKEIHRIVVFLYQGAETVISDEKTKLLVQLSLLDRAKRASE
jgi:hypothetical protein